jgi:hypothetical protein
MTDRKVPPLDLGDTTKRPTAEQLDAVMQGFADSVKRKKAAARKAADPLGYDTSDDVAAVRKMAKDAAAGKDDDVVKAEAKRLAALFGRRKADG